jgi:hypothetical protein
MNQDVFVDCIERAVGPVRASGPRKDRMREELAAHLAASWAEERARLGDDRAAAERAIRRLGEIEEIRRSLEDSVPRLERWLFTPLSSLSFLDALDRASFRRDDETPLHHAVRVTIGLTAAGACAMLLGFLVAIATEPTPRVNWPTRLFWSVASLVVMAAGGIIFPLLCEAMIGTLQKGRRGWLRAALYATLSSFVVIALGLGFVLMVSIGPQPGLLFDRSDWLRLLAASLIAPPFLAVAARSAIARRRSRSGWGIVEISP